MRPVVPRVPVATPILGVTRGANTHPIETPRSFSSLALVHFPPFCVTTAASRHSDFIDVDIKGFLVTSIPHTQESVS